MAKRVSPPPAILKAFEDAMTSASCWVPFEKSFFSNTFLMSDMYKSKKNLDYEL